MRYVIALDTTLRLIADRAAPASGVQLVAPTLLRSQIVADLYAAMRRGDIDLAEADARLDHFRALKPRLLGDRVLQRVSMSIAAELGWEDTYQAEYLALTRLQADAFVTLDPHLARTAAAVVPVAKVEDITG